MKTGRRERERRWRAARPEADQESRAKTALPSSVNSSPSAEPGAKSSRRPRRQKPAGKEVPLPDDWKPDFDWAVKLGIGLEEASRESEKFRNYAQMKGRVMVNWDAAWRQWCLRAIEFRTKSRLSNSPSSSLPSVLPNGKRMDLRIFWTWSIESFSRLG